MLKKILYIIASFIIGFLVILTSLFSNFSKVLFTLTADSVANKDYLFAERFFSPVIAAETKFYEGDIDGVHIEIYSAINDQANVVYDADGKPTDKSYFTLESCIQISVFHLPENFTLEDKYDGETLVSQGGVEFKFTGSDKTVFFPYSSDKVNYYKNYSSYAFLPLGIPYSEYEAMLTKEGISLDSVVEKVTIYDGDRDVVYPITFAEGKAPNFQTSFHNSFHEILVRYNKIQKDEADRSVTNKQLTDEEKTALEEEVKDIEKKYLTALETPGYARQHDVNIVYSSTEFIVSMVISAVIFLIVDILLGWFIFRKKKVPTYVPPGRKQQTAVARQPEQFSRQLFEAEEDVIDVPAEQTVSETTTTDSEE